MAAATDAGASDFILITNQAASRGGLFGGGGSSSVAAVAKSGLEYAVIRAPGYDRVPDAFGEGRSIVVGGAGGGVITPGAAVSGLQVGSGTRTSTYYVYGTMHPNTCDIKIIMCSNT